MVPMEPSWQTLLIVLVIIVIVFGGARIAGIGKASGQAIREFKDELKGPDAQQSTATAAPVAPVAAPAAPAAAPVSDVSDATSPGQATTV